jgi:hypothetical protein
MANIYNMSDTWNDGATTFTSIKMNVTDTASASGSLLMDLQVGGSSRFRVNKNGRLFGTGSVFGGIDFTSWLDVYISSGGPYYRFSSFTFRLGNGGVLEFCGGSAGSAGDAFFLRDGAANTLAQRNGTNAQTFNIYNTYTDASNYERVKLGWSANTFQLIHEASGTGSSIRNYEIATPSATITMRAARLDFWEGVNKFYFDAGAIYPYAGVLSIGTAAAPVDNIYSDGGTVVLSNLPTADPVNAGQLWNDAGTLKISAG